MSVIGSAQEGFSPPVLQKPSNMSHMDKLPAYFKTTYVIMKGVWEGMWDNEGLDSVAQAYVFQACVP